MTIDKPLLFTEVPPGKAQIALVDLGHRMLRPGVISKISGVRTDSGNFDVKVSFEYAITHCDDRPLFDSISKKEIQERLNG